LLVPMLQSIQSRDPIGKKALAAVHLKIACAENRKKVNPVSKEISVTSDYKK